MEPLHLRRGYSLIELLVVLAIIGVITVVVLTSQGTFNKTLILANASYDVALTLRSAQAFGLGSRFSGTAANVSYGLHFERATPDKFILFADTSGGTSCAGAAPDCKGGDRIYTPGSDTLVRTFELRNGITISDYCAIGGSTVCSAAISSLDISFMRPNPDTYIMAGGSPYTSACLRVLSPQGLSRFIGVGPSGLITANRASCP